MSSQPNAAFLQPAPDAVVLGCTHEILLKRAISCVVGKGCALLEGFDGVARETKRRSGKAKLLSNAEKGQIQFINSLSSQEILALPETLLQLP